MSKNTDVYDPYSKDHPINVSIRSRNWLNNRVKSGEITPSYAENFCIHALMVGKPRANASRETGSGCMCQVEVWVDEFGWPDNVTMTKGRRFTYDEWMDLCHSS